MNAWPDFVFPDENGFTNYKLDEYLANGYYRMQHLLFTTHQTQLSIQHKDMPVFWLRVPVKTIVENKAAQAVRKKCALFNVIFGKAAIDQEIDDLYSSYKKSIDFDAADTCSSYLHDANIPNPFSSQLVQVRDGKVLIATGYFDVGNKSMAGILNFYHPAYKKYSLGKYLMLKKIDYARENNVEFYYTGYISTETKKFDYKIFPDENAIEVFLPVEKQWLPYHKIGKQKLAEYFEKYIR